MGMTWQPQWPDDLRDRLQLAYDQVDAPQKLVGYDVPDEAAAWAEERNLAWHETKFAPPGRLFIIGALPVELP